MIVYFTILFGFVFYHYDNKVVQCADELFDKDWAIMYVPPMVCCSKDWTSVLVYQPSAVSYEQLVEMACADPLCIHSAQN